MGGVGGKNRKCKLINILKVYLKIKMWYIHIIDYYLIVKKT